MTIPITGPFSKTDTSLGPSTQFGRAEFSRRYRFWYRQRRPYSLPLRFTYQYQVVLSWYHDPKAITSNWGDNDDGAGFLAVNSSTSYPDVYNKAYARFVAQMMKDTAGMAVNLAQRRQAIDMIAHRAGQLTSFVRNLRAGRIGKALDAVGLERHSTSVRVKSKGFANQFLELHFGWEPLIKDIYSAVNILQDGVPPSKIRSSSSGKASGVVVELNDSFSRIEREWSDIIGWRIGADVFVSNPNLFLANQLGLVNPALVAWDVIPYSFVLGWFVNVEQFLAQFTDFWGVTVVNPYIAFLWTRNTRKREWQKNWPAYPTPNTILYRDYRFQRTQADRVPGSIPGPTLRVRPPWVVSPVRGLTAISLLLQKLKGGR